MKGFNCLRFAPPPRPPSWKSRIRHWPLVHVAPNYTCYCFVDALVVPTGATPHREQVLSYGSSVLIIIAVSLTIGLGVLVIGLCCLRT